MSIVIKGLQQRLYSEVVDCSALWGFVNGFDDIPRAKNAPKRTVTPTLAFKMRYNEDGSINHTLKEIGDHFGVGKNAVRHHIEKGSRRLNHPSRRVSWGELPPDMAEKWREINRRNKQKNENLSREKPMSEATEEIVFLPTSDMMRFWPQISEKTAVEIVNTHTVLLQNMETVDMVLIGDQWCYYYEEIDTLFVYYETAKDEPAQAQPPQTFEVWGILELMGHVKTAGLISEQELFGTKLGRIDIPAENGQMITQYFGGGSIYRLTPVSEMVARAFAARNVPRPVSIYDLKLAAPEPEEEEDYDNDY